MFENPRRRRQARNFTTNVPKVLNLKSLPNSFRKLTLGAPDKVMNLHDDSHRYYLPVIMPVNRQLIHPNKDEFRFCSVCLSLFSVFFSFPFSGGRYRLNKMHQIFWNILHSILNTFLRLWINSNARNQHLRAEWILVQNDWQFDEAAILIASPRAIRNELRKRKPRLPLQGIKCKTTDTRGLR